MVFLVVPSFCENSSCVILSFSRRTLILSPIAKRFTSPAKKVYHKECNVVNKKVLDKRNNVAYNRNDVTKEVNRMLVLFCVCELSAERKDVVRAEVKKRTGEDCLIVGPGFTDVRQIETNKDRAASPRKRLPWPFRE